MYPLIYAILTVLVIIFIIFLKSFQKHFRVWHLARQFKGPKCWPIVGHAYLFFGCKPEQIYKIIEQHWNHYGKTMKFWYGSEFSVFMGDTKDVEYVLGTTHLLSKSNEYKYLKTWLNEGLLLSLPKKWFKRRRVLTPGFHFKILEDFIDVFDRTSRVFVNNLERDSKRNDDSVIELNKLVNLVTLDVICGKFNNLLQIYLQIYFGKALQFKIFFLKRATIYRPERLSTFSGKKNSIKSVIRI